MMSGIRSTNTKPELLLRKALFSRGYRYRLNVKTLPGKPDLVFPRYRAVIFVNGCFWHGHDCHLFKWPSTRPDFWQSKIEGNRARDRRVSNEIRELGWRQAHVWECALKGKTRHGMEYVIEKCDNWLRSQRNFEEIRGL
jgi:DNA mismatch endonuclease (patch repair protein)